MIFTTTSKPGSRRRVSCLSRAAIAVLALLMPLSTFADDAGELIAAAGIGSPVSALITGSDGHRYGVTGDGGPVTPGSLPTIASGTVFRLAPDGDVTVLHVFSINDPDGGWGPRAALVEGPDGNFYGTTAFGGLHCADCGTIFRITPAGVHTRLHSFNGNDGAAPASPLTVGADGRLYGATDGAVTGFATLFAITTNGRFELLRSESVESGLATTQALAVEMLATVQTFDPDVFPDANTALLDDFDRADSATLGQNWTTLPTGFGSTTLPGGIDGSAQVSNLHAIGGIGDTVGGNYWNTPFEADQEVFGFFFLIDYDTAGLHVRYNPETGNGYAVNWDAGLFLYRVINNQFTQIGGFSGMPFDNNPDPLLGFSGWLGLRAVGNNISVWRSSDGTAWTNIIDVTDNQVQNGGHAGFHLYHTRHSFDDFHAGSLDVPPPPPPPPPPDDDDDGGDGGDGGDDGGNNPGNGGGVTDPNVNPITGSPGGGQRGGITLGATGLEALALLLLLWGRTTASLCIKRISGRKMR